MIHKESSSNVRPTKILSALGARDPPARSTLTHGCKHPIPPSIFPPQPSKRTEVSYLSNRVSEIRDLINDKNGENFLSNKEIKLFLVELFGSSIQFCPSERKNESLMVFSSEIELQDIVKKMRSLDNIKTAAATIRQSLLD